CGGSSKTQLTYVRSVELGMRKLIFTLINLFAVLAHAELPQWVTSGTPPDAAHAYVVCSAEGLDPQNIQQIAENNCLASAAKLPGVTVTIKQKTVQSLSGVDSNEVAQITPLQATVKCEWTHRHLESIGTAFRLFLECQVDKKSLSVHSLKSEEQVDQSRSSAGPANALLTVATTPRADVIAISGA